MMKAAFIAAALLLPLCLYGQKPEQQRSFAVESRPHEYYVQQAGLWWKELEQDSTSESNWYNYFRACRNAQGTADWRTDFVEESPYLRAGPEIVALMENHIPESFTYYYLSYLDGGIGTAMGPNLMKAYAMNPEFEGIHSSVISYAVSNLDDSLRREVNSVWYTCNYLSYQLLNYSYNVLQSLDSNAILFTQHDNDTYPLWMLQDALGIRTDVSVVNIDFLLLDRYRKHTLSMLSVKPLSMEVKSVDDYHLNWQKVVRHILTFYNGRRPLYIGMTLFESLYKDFEDQLHVSGLALRFAKNDAGLPEFNRRLYEDRLLLDYLKMRLASDRNQTNIDYQNLNYLRLFKQVFDNYTLAGNLAAAEKLRTLAYLLASRIGDADFSKRITAEFN